MFRAESRWGRVVVYSQGREGFRSWHLDLKGHSKGRIQDQRKRPGLQDGMLIKGTGLTLGVGCEDLVPAPRFLQLSQPQSRPERFLVRQAAKQPALSSVS